MKVIPSYFIVIFLTFCITACNVKNSNISLQSNFDKDDAKKQLTYIASRYNDCLPLLEVDSTKIPRATEPDNILIVSPSRQWTSGFFPGSLYQIGAFTEDASIINAAKIWTSFVEKEKWDTHTHDLGFKVNSCFGKGYEYHKDPKYRDVIIQASNTLIKRYNPTVGAIRSWDWGKDRWEFPVIIDNMMNLEMLFDAFTFTGDSIYYNIAKQHAYTTLHNHFKADNSSYHVIDYDPNTGNVRNKHTHQGLSHESAWSRGQAWGLYGFTKAYERTGEKAFLDQALRIYNFIFNHPNLPQDLIPYWDFDAPQIPLEPRDASAAAVIASTLFNLSNYDSKNQEKMISQAQRILYTLSSHPYRSKVCPFILDHSVGSVPGKFEIDVPITYADYYYIEALLKATKYLN